MKFHILINQVRALEWGINSQQAMLFAYLFNTPSWATAVEVDGKVYCHISKGKIIDDMPLLTDKPDTAYRLLKQLAEKGLILLTSQGNKTLVCITEKGATWDQQDNKKAPSEDRKNIRPTSENYPIKLGKISDQGSEKSPTDKVISNTGIKYKNTYCSEPSAESSEPSETIDEVVATLPTNKFARCGEQYRVVRSQVEYFESVYPGVNVPQVINRIQSWLIANDKRRKTLDGMPRFIDTWLAKEQNSGGAKHAITKQPGNQSYAAQRADLTDAVTDYRRATNF